MTSRSASVNTADVVEDRVATLYSNAAQTITASGVSAAIDTSAYTWGLLVAYVKGTVTGTSPTLTITLEVEDGAGNYITTVQLTAITSGPNYSISKLGGAEYPLTQSAKVRWTVGGTDTPTFNNVDISMVGRTGP